MPYNTKASGKLGASAEDKPAGNNAQKRAASANNTKKSPKNEAKTSAGRIASGANKPIAKKPATPKKSAAVSKAAGRKKVYKAPDKSKMPPAKTKAGASTSGTIQKAAGASNKPKSPPEVEETQPIAKSTERSNKPLEPIFPAVPAQTGRDAAAFVDELASPQVSHTAEKPSRTLNDKLLDAKYAAAMAARKADKQPDTVSNGDMQTKADEPVAKPEKASEKLQSAKDSVASALVPKAKAENKPATPEKPVLQSKAKADSKSLWKRTKADGDKAVDSVQTLPKPAEKKNVAPSVVAAEKKTTQTRAAPVKKKAPATKPKKARKKAKKTTAPLFSGVGSDIANMSFFKGIGNMLYSLGFYAECKALLIWRALREVGIFIGQLFVWLFRGFINKVRALIKGIGRDLASPFVRFAEGMQRNREIIEKERKKTKTKGTQKSVGHLGRDLASYLRLLFNILSYALPVAAAGIFLFTVYSMVDQSYLLAVQVNGEVVGYVSDVNELEDAKTILRERIQLTEGQTQRDWSISPEFRIATAEALTTKQQLANNILISYKSEGAEGDERAIIEATGLYIENNLYAVTLEGEQLKDYIETWRKSYEDENNPDAIVNFVHDVRVGSKEGDVEEIFFESTVVEYPDMLKDITREISPEEKYTAKLDDTLISIAEQHSVTVDALKIRNPELAALAADSRNEDEYKPGEGTEVLIRRAQPFLQIQKTYNKTEREAVPYQVIEQEDPKKSVGMRTVAQKGVEGYNFVDYAYMFVDGELASRMPIDGSERVDVPAVDEIVKIGTYVFVPGEGGAFDGAFIWPMPGDTGTSRGRSAHHRGVDITGAANTPVLAIEGGVVTNASYHSSWGNNVVISHPNGMTSLYAHFNTLAVQVGDVVGKGEVVGYCGSTGNSSGNHLHLEMTVDGVLVDPFNYVGRPG